jgi:hypothetical protein
LLLLLVSPAAGHAPSLTYNHPFHSNYTPRLANVASAAGALAIGAAAYKLRPGYGTRPAQVEPFSSSRQTPIMTTPYTAHTKPDLADNAAAAALTVLLLLLLQVHWP